MDAPSFSKTVNQIIQYKDFPLSLSHCFLCCIQPFLLFNHISVNTIKEGLGCHFRVSHNCEPQHLQGKCSVHGLGHVTV